MSDDDSAGSPRVVPDSMITHQKLDDIEDRLDTIEELLHDLEQEVRDS